MLKEKSLSSKELNGKTKVARGWAAADVGVLFLMMGQIFFSTLFSYGLPALAFRYGTSLLIVLRFLTKWSALQTFLSTAKFFALFIAVCLITLPLSVELPLSLSSLVIFLLSIIAASTASAIEEKRLYNYVILFYSFFIVVSIGVSIFMPALGAVAYGSSSVWKGLAASKNHFGWNAATLAVVTLAFPSSLKARTKAVVYAISVIALIGSGAMTAVVTFLAATGYLYLIRLEIKKKFAIVLAITLNIVMLVAVVALIALGGQIFVEALGRDLTFTGRTEVWQVYFERAMDFVSTGAGAGTFTNPSIITDQLAKNHYFEGQYIRTPHNMLIGVFGDTGIWGVLTFYASLIWVTFIRPLVERTPSAIACATLGVSLLVEGLTEAASPFSMTIAWFLFFLALATSVRGEKQREANKPETTGLMPGGKKAIDLSRG